MKEKEPTYTALLESIEHRLRHGQLRIGDRLPGERSLAEEYGISRASVREALPWSGYRRRRTLPARYGPQGRSLRPWLLLEARVNVA